MTATDEGQTAGETDQHTPIPVASGHAHADDHLDDHAAEHTEPPPGPIDWGAWIVSAIGVGAGCLVALVLYIAIQHG